MYKWKLLLGITLACIGYAFIPWEWSFIDDSNLRFLSEKFRQQHGFFLGIWHHIVHHAIDDKGWGLFRPSYWIYQTTVYVFPPWFAYTLRFVFFIGMIGMVIRLTKEIKPEPVFQVLAAAFVLSNSSLYWGLSFPSLQEFSGCFFATIGMYLSYSQSSFWRAFVFYLIAALFKAPFIWLIFSHSFCFWFYQKARKTWIPFSIASIIFAIMFLWAREGFYTSRYGMNVDAMVTTLRSSIVPFSYFAVLGLAVLFTFRMTPQKWAFGDTLAFSWFFSGLLYFAQLLPWSASGYYLMGPYHLLTLGLFFLTLPRLQAFRSPSARTIGLSTCIAVAAFAFTRGYWKILSRNQTNCQLRDWALSLPPSGLKLAINFDEPASRFYQLMQLRTNMAWTNEVVYIPDYQNLPQDTDYYIVLTETGAIIPPVGQLESILTWGRILKLKN